jgi:hypothetical protein
MKSRILSASAIALVLAAVGATASADLSKKVIAEFKGQIVVSSEGLEAAGDDKAAIAAIKKARLKEVKGEPNGDDVVAWKFNYTAFLKKTGATELTFEFYTDDKDARYAANQRLAGVDPTTPVLTGAIEITEDDGLARGKSYKLKLSGKIKGKDVVLAETPIQMK